MTLAQPQQTAPEVDLPLDVFAVASMLYLSPWTLRQKKSQGQMPEPDGRFGAVDWWYTSTIEAWGTGQTTTAEQQRDTPCDIRAAAELLGYSHETFRTYRTRLDFPEPDGHVGKSQWWWASTLRGWNQQRCQLGRTRGNRARVEQLQSPGSSDGRAVAS